MSLVRLSLLLSLALPTLASATELRLNDALRYAVEHNVEIAQARIEEEAARLDLPIARATLLPQVSIDNGFHDKSPYENGRNRYLQTLGRIFWQLPVGMQLGLGVSNVWVHEGSGGLPLSSVGVDVSQPLLAGAWGASHDLDATHWSESIQSALFVDAVNEVLLRVEKAYWRLVLAQHNVAITERSVGRAQAQFDETTENIRRGLLAPGDIFVVEENLVFFQEQLVRANENRQTAAAALADLLRMEPAAELVATESPLLFAHAIPPNPDPGLHPQMVARSLRRKQASQRLVNARQNHLPQFDVRAGASLDGTETWDEIGQAQHPNFEVGVVFAAPLSWEAKDAVLEERELASRRAQLDEERTQRNLERDWHSLRAQVRARSEILTLAKKRVGLSEQKLETEMEKYKNGVSRLPEVVRFQRDVDSAQLAVIRAQIDVHTVAAALLRSMALRHESLGVTLR